MSECRKIVSHFEIHTSAEKYYKIFKHQLSHVPKICPKIFKEVAVHEGDWDTHGHNSIKIWNYVVDGKAEVLKERVEYDDKKLTVTIIGLEGDVFKHYKVFKGIYHIVPKGPDHSLAILTLEYEKLDDGVPCPYKYLDIMNALTKDIESHLKN